MYESFFGFGERPFDLTPNPRYLVLTDAHREALSNLEYAIASRKGVTLLLGEAGTGKTTVIRTALERQPERVHCVQLQNPALSRTEFVEMLASRFGLSARATTSKTALLLELEALLAGATRARRIHACWSSTKRRACRSNCWKRYGSSPTSRLTGKTRVGDSRGPAGAGRPAERAVAPPVEATRCASMRVSPADAPGKLCLHSRPNPGCRGRRRSDVHAGGRHPDARARQRHSAHAQRDCRQRPACRASPCSVAP